MVPSKKEFIASDLAAPMMWFVRVKTLGSSPSDLIPMRSPFLYSFMVEPEVVTTTCVHSGVSKLQNDCISRMLEICDVAEQDDRQP